ncbi:MAG: PAS domain S-box-containing protein/diguanylate cyclase (GGDEF)-like protein [Sulfurimonas sp.]|jgi:PAS domain S-box-containing protein/diguanylate cyclase (GGDEF)-like protein|uniref:sensor domain-containing diguanylate cyclase n=1 Tax=Sulfurimonas sp. TaxID=2022749 RepID=UPI0039E5912B
MSKDKNCMILENSSIDEVPITTLEYNNILNIQNEILGMIASQVKANDILTHLCKMAENLLPNSVASVMIQDKITGLLSVLSAPSVPKVGHEALKNLKPGPTGGSCGNAVFNNEAQYVSDTFSDSRWEDLRQVSHDFNLCACWSMPVRNRDNEPIGTFALSSFEHRSPASFHKKLLETTASIVNIVLSNKEDAQRLKLFSSSMQNAAEGMIITNSDNNIIEVNSAFEKIYGYTENEVIGRNPKIFATKHNTKELYNEMWSSIDKNASWANEIINIKADGSEITQWLSISKIVSDEGEANYLGIFTDLTELKNTQELLKKTAYRDHLTELPNKAQLDDLIIANKEQTLLLLNVNNFSYINSAYGFDTGDKLLMSLSKILNDTFAKGMTFRINSDEFGLLLDKALDVKAQVKKIKNYFYNTEISVEDITLNISFTYGACVAGENLLRNASSALKYAKQRGRNNLVIFDLEMSKNQERESFIESNRILYRAIAEDKVIPYYQGIRNNLSKKIEKFEVLARIEVDGEIITPNKFLEPARLSGILPEITKIMIDKSFKCLGKYECDFSINITEDDLTRDYLLEYLDTKCIEYGINPQRVILEILEGVSSDGKKNHIKQLRAIKAKGYSLAIDDFGSEYSNFERVLDLDIDYLKIDAKYIKDIHTNKKSYEVARAIVFFAKNVKIPCIAEFVHDENVQTIIDELGIDFSQGFYFSQPHATPKLA